MILQNSFEQNGQSFRQRVKSLGLYQKLLIVFSHHRKTRAVPFDEVITPYFWAVSTKSLAIFKMHRIVHFLSALTARYNSSIVLPAI